MNNTDYVSFDELEEIEETTQLTVIGIASSAELAINYLFDSKLKNINLYIVNQSSQNTSKQQAENIKQFNISPFENNISVSECKEGISKLLAKQCAIILVVDSDNTSNLQLAQKIGGILKAQRDIVLTLILNNTEKVLTSSTENKVNELIEQSNASLLLPISGGHGKEKVFNTLSVLIELILYRHHCNIDVSIDHVDVLTMLAGGNKLFNDEINPISHSEYSSIEGDSIFEAINHSVSRLQNKPAKNSNVLARVILNTDERDYDELETALKNIRNQYTGDCFIAPIHDASMSNTEVHVTVFITKSEKNKKESYKIPNFLKKS